MPIYAEFDQYGINVNINGPEEQSVTCPECSLQRKNKRAKCLSVNVVKQVWLCHHCGFAGGLKNDRYISDPHFQKVEYSKPKLTLDNPEVTAVIGRWFNSRCISASTLIRNKVFVAKTWMPQIEKEIEAIGFPYYRDSEHINTKWRDHKKHFKLEKGCELTLYGLDDIKDAKTIIWVEGEMDKLSLEEAGYLNCVSIPNGAPAVDSKNFAKHFDYLNSCENILSGKIHILFLDADRPGRHLEEELARRLGVVNCSRVRLPDGYKDANDYLVAFGRDALKEAVEGAKSFPVAGIHDANSLRGLVQQLHEDGLKPGVKTGWVCLDHLYTVRQGEMCIVTGIPNHGKSYFLDCMTLNIARESGWRFGIFSPENQPLQNHAAAYCEKFLGKPFNDCLIGEINAVMCWLQDHYYWILPDVDDDWSLTGILEKAKSLVFRYGINGLIIDPWNEVAHNRTAAQSETEYISLALTQIRQFARLHNVAVWVVAHPAKLRKDDDGTYPVPTPYDISGSAHWRNKADNCIAVHRLFDESKMGISEIWVQKVRFKEIGQVGMCNLKYEESACNYREVSQSEYNL